MSLNNADIIKKTEICLWRFLKPSHKSMTSQVLRGLMLLPSILATEIRTYNRTDNPTAYCITNGTYSDCSRCWKCSILLLMHSWHFHKMIYIHASKFFFVNKFKLET
jgi:hypothetical protein